MSQANYRGNNGRPNNNRPNNGRSNNNRPNNGRSNNGRPNNGRYNNYESNNYESNNYESNNDESNNDESTNNPPNHIIASLQDYMFTSKNMSKSICYTNEQYDCKIKEKKKNKCHKRLTIIEQKDHLFWIFYIIRNGFEDYSLICNNHYKIEKDRKIKLISEIHANKSLLKDYKIKKLSECENDLLNEEKISFKTFHALCVLYNIQFYFLQHRTIYKNIMLDSEKTYVIHKLDGPGNYGLEHDVVDDVLDNYTNVRFEIDNYEKPLKGMSSYKLEDLQKICGTMCISLENRGKKKTKVELYNELIIYFN